MADVDRLRDHAGFRRICSVSTRRLLGRVLSVAMDACINGHPSDVRVHSGVLLS